MAVQPTNQVLVEKIESFFNDSQYKELIESANNYNTRLCIERRLRLPFIDPQTGVAQNHSALFPHRRLRMPGLLPGQVYSYPRQRWRKRKRPYLDITLRHFMRPADGLPDNEVDLHNISQSENPALQDTDSKDSQLQLLKDEKEWFYDEQDMLEIDPYDEPDQDSDLDYEETFSRRSKRKRTPGRGRNTDSPSTPGRKKGSGRGRKKVIHNFEAVSGDPDKPFGCERISNRRGRHSVNNHLPPQSSLHSSSTSAPASSTPPTLPPNLPAATSHHSNSVLDDPPMPILMPEKSLEHHPTLPPPPPPTTSTTTPTSGPHLNSAASLHPPPTPLSQRASPPPQIPPFNSASQPLPAAAMAGHAQPPPHHQHNNDATPNNKEKNVQPSPYCDFCLGDQTQNKKTGQMEELVSCSDCGRSGHPTCLLFTDNMKISVKKYSWQCIECKCCSVCGTSDNDDQLLFCDDCDRGYHMYCLTPALTDPPEGSWSCKLCIAEFHKK